MSSNAAFEHVVNRVRESVCPLITTAEGKQFIAGTATLVESKDHFFLVTAKHVVEGLASFGIPGAGGTQTSDVGAIAKYFTEQPFDVAVIEILEPQSASKLQRSWKFIHLDDICIDPASESGFYFVYGFPSESANFGVGEMTTRFLALSSNLAAGPSEISCDSDPINPKVDFWLEFDERACLPTLYGISGCSVWKVVNSPIALREDRALRLVGIETGFIRGKWIRCRRWGVIRRVIQSAIERSA